ncbi:TetR/AcrR family transcriptional regulator [Arthrobacter sp. Y-9]|uniref:TetR/AcrR family transcriptional regulator n=1 Tax=Arthrobacter sp. Y-9 TaxID=3039385 RepID=UPI00241E4724|nr:TetR/AcrR family transcriptional regulator [Arthrobacter sp. Y-9]WFR84894.1 TetR/AcrR family transcriptional regulator [Arthrobacter sp. Y-9]
MRTQETVEDRIPEKRSADRKPAAREPYTLDRLLDVAVRVFTERGYDGTSFQHLSQASGLSKSSIYHHIDSKEQLLRLGLEKALEPLMATITEPEATTGPAIDRLRFLIRRNIEILTDRLPYVTLLLNVHGNTETERWALEQRRTYNHAVAAVVQEAIDQGGVRSDVDAKTTARLVFGMINSVREWYRPERGEGAGRTRGAGLNDGAGSNDGAARLADQVLSLLLDGIRTR